VVGLGKVTNELIHILGKVPPDLIFDVECGVWWCGVDRYSGLERVKQIIR